LFNNAKLALDSPAPNRYIANHMTNRGSQQNRISLELQANTARPRRVSRIPPAASTQPSPKESTMNRFRIFAIATTLIVALAAPAQQTAQQSGMPSTMPSVDQHLKALAEKLDLTPDQQAKAKPILQEMQDGMAKLNQDQSLSPEERHEKSKPLHMKADKQIREFLTDDQKKKLDQLEQQPHPELHATPNGATPPSQ
jgi:Spy/CpxP family protein refolding chaperone